MARVGVSLRRCAVGIAGGRAAYVTLSWELLTEPQVKRGLKNTHELAQGETSLPKLMV